MAEHERRGRDRERLDTPLLPRRSPLPQIRVNPDSFGAMSESVARFFGTGRFLVMQTLIVLVWIVLNVVLPRGSRWDVYPFILLNLAFSTQAAYAAPFILLAQNRQADRDRVQIEEDRAANVRQREDIDYVTRELAAVRIALGEAVTRDFLRNELRTELRAEMKALREDLARRDDEPEGSAL